MDGADGFDGKKCARFVLVFLTDFLLLNELRPWCYFLELTLTKYAGKRVSFLEIGQNPSKCAVLVKNRAVLVFVLDTAFFRTPFQTLENHRKIMFTLC